MAAFELMNERRSSESKEKVSKCSYDIELQNDFTFASSSLPEAVWLMGVYNQLGILVNQRSF